MTTFEGGVWLEFARGNFDDWCIYLCRNNNGTLERIPPRDKDYFKRLQMYAQHIGPQRMYEDFVRVYDISGTQCTNEGFNYIKQLSAYYGDYSLMVAVDLSILYMGMVAENNKKNAVLGKRIKRLGVHQVLLENYHPEVAANFSRGKKVPELRALCETRGF